MKKAMLSPAAGVAAGPCGVDTSEGRRAQAGEGGYPSEGREPAAWYDRRGHRRTAWPAVRLGLRSRMNWSNQGMALGAIVAVAVGVVLAVAVMFRWKKPRAQTRIDSTAPINDPDRRG